jgi:hypothetical protein
MLRSTTSPIRALLVGAVLVGVLAAGLTAGVADAKAKPGLLPGTWVGKGTIKGHAADGPMSTHFSGGVTFTLRVDKKLHVSGGGTWKMRMLGSEDGPSETAVDSSMQGSAAIRLAGASTGPTFSGVQQVRGEIRMGQVARPISFTRPLTGQLVINRAGRCKVTGVTTIQPGVTLTWKAVLKGSGTCNA